MQMQFFGGNWNKEIKDEFIRNFRDYFLIRENKLNK